MPVVVPAVSVNDSKNPSVGSVIGVPGAVVVTIPAQFAAVVAVNALPPNSYTLKTAAWPLAVKLTVGGKPGLRYALLLEVTRPDAVSVTGGTAAVLDVAGADTDRVA